MTRTAAVAAMLTSALLVAGCTGGGDDDKADAENPSTAAGGQLFVASAGDGTLQPGDAEHEWKLTLGQAHDSIGVFTDRPQRKAGTESIADFTANWDERGFAETPPNAAVVWGKDSTSRVFELSEPAYDEAADSLSFTAHDLGDEPSTALSSFEGTPDAELPTELGEVSVFIDNASTPQSGAFFFIVAPGNSEATVTIDDQTLDYVGFNVVQGAGAGRQESSHQFEVACTGDKTCYIAVDFTLTPGTWPVTGNLEASNGVKVTRSKPDGTKATVPAGDFSIAQDGA